MTQRTSFFNNCSLPLLTNHFIDYTISVLSTQVSLPLTIRLQSLTSSFFYRLNSRAGLREEFERNRNLGETFNTALSTKQPRAAIETGIHSVIMLYLYPCYFVLLTPLPRSPLLLSPGRKMIIPRLTRTIFPATTRRYWRSKTSENQQRLQVAVECWKRNFVLWCRVLGYLNSIRGWLATEFYLTEYSNIKFLIKSRM